MIRDWDLWPWIIAANAPSALSIETMRIIRGIEAVQRAIGMDLCPIVRAAAKAMQAVLDA